MIATDERIEREDTEYDRRPGQAMTLPERCRAQARSMDSEGWYVCANVLDAAADKIEELESRIEAERADHQATIAHCEKYHCQREGADL